MDIKVILDVLGYVLSICLGGVALYIKGKKTITDNAVKYINEAEEGYQNLVIAKGEKFDYVVDNIYNLIPTVVRPFVTKDLVAIIVQNIFDQMESYAVKQADKIVDKILEKPENK